jgi:hypothetical protein
LFASEYTIDEGDDDDGDFVPYNVFAPGALRGASRSVAAREPPTDPGDDLTPQQEAMVDELMSKVEKYSEGI